MKRSRPVRDRHEVGEPEPFGYLMCLDCYECDAAACDSLDLLHKFFDELVVALKMEKQGPAHAFMSDQIRFPDKAGFSGWCPLIESGISAHSITPKRFVSLDIYSCRYFSEETVLVVAEKFFKFEFYESKFIPRGLRYHEHS